MSQLSFKLEALALATLIPVLGACMDGPVAPVESRLEARAVLSVNGFSPPPPGGLVTYDDLELWPWTGVDLAGTVSDPINLIFTGEVDVLSLRAALLSLDGDRTPDFPPAYPFNCTWNDAHGSMQSTYSDGAGWVGNAIQLQCGSYDPLRFHIRLFDAGDYVVAGVHFDLLIPNTAQHQVLAWDFPEVFVTYDFIRTGLLGAAPSGALVNTPGSVQEIPQPLYNGIPDELKVLFGLPPGPTGDPAVPIPNDGIATVLELGQKAPVLEGTEEYDLSFSFNLPIPRPFCSQGPADFVLVQGPVHLTVRTHVNAMGIFESHNTLRGDLQITPFDLQTQQPYGETVRAQISEIDNTGVGPTGTSVNAVLMRKALPPGVGFLKTHLRTSPNGAARFIASEKCD